MVNILVANYMVIVHYYKAVKTLLEDLSTSKVPQVSCCLQCRVFTFQVTCYVIKISVPCFTREWPRMSGNNYFPVHGCTKQCSILNYFSSTASKSLVLNSVTPSDQREEDFILGVVWRARSGARHYSGSIALSTSSGL